MAYSLNFYLDNPVSVKQLSEIEGTGNAEVIKEVEKIIATKKLQIFVYLRYSGKTIKVYTDHKCTQKQWDGSKQLIDHRQYKGGASEINVRLGKIRDAVSKLHESNINNKIATTKDQIKAIINEINNKAVKTETSTLSFEQAFDLYIKTGREGTVTQKKKSPNTVKNYVSTFNHLKGYAKRKGIKLSYELIDEKFEYKFREYLISANVKDTDDATNNELSDNTIAKYLKILKSFLKFSIKEKFCGNIENLAFDVKEEEKEVYVLTLPELMKLFNYKFDNPALSQVRDVFCFSCFTGLRHSDILNLRREYIQKENLCFTSLKTGAKMNIPLNPFAQQILAKYKDQDKPLPVISNQKSNEHLKTIGELLEFNELVRVVEYKKKEIIERFAPKHEVLTFHVGRKTFITNSLVLGIDERYVKEFSGHKTEKDFRKYVKLADNYKQKAMNNAWSQANIDSNSI